MTPEERASSVVKTMRIEKVWGLKTLIAAHIRDARNEALEEAAKAAESRHAKWGDGEVSCDVTACEDIAKAIRLLKDPAS
jgi:hypothetical protein